MEPSRSERSFTCIHCNRTFRRLEHLQRHTRIHTNEKPFTCHCGASFTRRDLLKRHVRIAHPPSPASDHNAGDVGVGDVALGVGTQGSIAQNLLSEGNHGDTVIVETSLPDQCCAKRTLRLPLPPEYRHVEDAFRDETCGSALHDLLQDALGNAKPSGDHTTLGGITPAASAKDSHAIRQTRAEGRSGVAHREYVTPNEAWREAGLRSTAVMREHLVQSLLRHGQPTEPLPSAQSLSRYIQAFLDGFHERYSIFHTQTMTLADFPPDIGFSFLAVGADSCFESKAAMYLFESAVAVSSVGSRNFRDTINPLFASHEMLSTTVAPNSSGENAWLDESSRLLCVMLLLTFFALENRSPPAMQIMWSIQGVLAHELRQSLMSVPRDSEDHSLDEHTSWIEWARRESQQRVKHAAFCVLNLVSMTFDFPSPVSFAQLHVAVPCSAEEWRAPTADDWIKLHRKTPAKPILLSGLVEYLFADGQGDTISSSVLGDFTVLHAILQPIRTLRQALNAVPESILTQIESSLYLFTKSPSVPPNLNNSRVYLLAGLAHLQLHIDTTPFPTMSQDVAQLAAWLQSFPLPDRHTRWFPVLRSTIQMLDAQIERGLGVDNHPFDTGVDAHGFLCAINLPIFLIKWLLLMADSSHEQMPGEDERQIIQSAGDVVVEAGRCIELGTRCIHTDGMSIASGVATIMSHVCQRSPKEHVNLFGKAFGLYATVLQDGEDYLDHQSIADLPSDQGDIR